MIKKFEIKSIESEINKLCLSFKEIIKDEFLKREHNDSSWKKFYVAFQEAIKNAYEHGNLGLTFDEKLKFLESNTLDKELKKREEKLGERLIIIELLVLDNTINITIEDQGVGYLATDDIQNKNLYLESLSGRGLKLIESYCDKVIINERGNKITLSKKLN